MTTNNDERRNEIEFLPAFCRSGCSQASRLLHSRRTHRGRRRNPHPVRVAPQLKWSSRADVARRRRQTAKRGPLNACVPVCLAPKWVQRRTRDCSLWGAQNKVKRASIMLAHGWVRRAGSKSLLLWLQSSGRLFVSQVY